jgi:Mn2+/Fe2+ NRAMP family transporter
MLANNDAGGMLEYTLSGVHFGAGIFIPLLFLLAPLSYAFQERVMRLSLSTRRSYSGLVRAHIGRYAGLFSICAMAAGNILYIITEFIGMTAPLVFSGLPLWAASLVSLIFISAITLLWDERRQDKIALFVGAVNITFIIAAFMCKPDFSDISRFDFSPLIGGNKLILFILATIGNTIAPFMLFFQPDSESNPQKLKAERKSIAIGAILQPFFAAIAVICGAALVGQNADSSIKEVSPMIQAFAAQISPATGVLYAIGLFNAAWLAAITITRATTIQILSVCGREKARVYTIVINAALLLTGALVVQIPHISLSFFAVLTQIVGAVLLVPDLVYLAILTNSRKIMGNFVNTPRQCVISWGLVALFAIVAIAACYSVI